MLNAAPKKAISLATIALQMQILIRAPIRIGNLLSIRLDYHLKRMEDATPSYQLYFPHYDVKNRTELDFPLTDETAEMLDQYIQNFRPRLGPGHQGDLLFPGENNKSRSSTHASVYIAETVEERVGLRLTAHQFRHAAATVILKQRPGDYEFVRRILGHLNIVTTTRFYTALEAFAASKIYGSMVEGLIREIPLRRKSRTRRKPPAIPVRHAGQPR